MNRNLAIGVTAVGTVAAGAVWVSLSGPKVNEGGYQVVNGAVLPPEVSIDASGAVTQYEASGDPNKIVSLGGREYALGGYDAERAAYEYVVLFYQRMASSMALLQRAIPAATWGEILGDYATSGYTRIRPARYCTEAEQELFRGFLRIALAFGQSLRVLGYCSVATGRVTAFAPLSPNLTHLVYTGQLNPLCAGQDSRSVTIQYSWDWIKAGQEYLQAFVSAYQDLIPVTGSDMSELSAEFREQQAISSGEDMQGMGFAIAPLIPIAGKTIIWIIIVLGAVQIAKMVMRSASVALTGEAAFSELYEDMVHEYAECVQDEDRDAEVRAACERQYTATLDRIHSIQAGVPSLTKWIGIGVIGILGIAGGYYAIKAVKSRPAEESST